MHDNQREALSYIAGILDGEGSIMITRQASQTFMKNRKHPNYCATVRIGMLTPEPLRLIESFGFGKVYIEKPYHHRRPMYRIWIRSKDEVKRFLESVKPWVLVKKQQLELALDFIEKAAGKPGHRITQKMADYGEESWLKMRTLNGVEAPATTKREGKRGRDNSVPFEAIV